MYLMSILNPKYSLHFLTEYKSRGMEVSGKPVSTSEQQYSFNHETFWQKYIFLDIELIFIAPI